MVVAKLIKSAEANALKLIGLNSMRGLCINTAVISTWLNEKCIKMYLENFVENTESQTTQSIRPVYNTLLYKSEVVQ